MSLGFRFYIVSLHEGCPLGTNDLALAKYYSTSPDCFVIDTEINLFMLEDGSVDNIREVFE